jgi:hypothetical protein
MGGPRWSYTQVTKSAIYKYHRTKSDSEAFRYFDNILPRVRLKQGARADEQRQNLTSYIEWHKQYSVLVADVRLRIDLQLSPGIIMGGEISRLDIDPDRDQYHAVLLTETGGFSPKELRLPLIQRAIALKYKREEGKIWIGFQRLDGSALNLIQFPKAAMTSALKKAQIMADQVLCVYKELRS